jgi:hypothetical protein
MSEEQSWRDMGKALLTLEVNTILKSSISAERMPSLPHAMLDIAQEYSGALLDFGVSLERYLVGPDCRGREAVARSASIERYLRSGPGEASIELRRLLSQEVRANASTFQRLRAAARRRQQGKAWPAESRDPEGNETDHADEPGLPRPEAAQRALLERIINNADTLIVILGRSPELAGFADKTRGELAKESSLAVNDITANHRMAIAKFWEIGCEEVLSQTVVTLTGDVTTRVVPRVMRPENAPGLDSHHRSVDVALACWKGLADAVVGVLRLVVGKPGP